MKKFSWILALLAALAVVFVGVGCGGGGGGEPPLAEDLVITDAAAIGALLTPMGYYGSGAIAGEENPVIKKDVNKAIFNYDVTTGDGGTDNFGFQLVFPEGVEPGHLSLEVTFKLAEVVTLTGGHAKIGFASAIKPSKVDVTPYPQHEVIFGGNENVGKEFVQSFSLNSPNKLPGGEVYFNHNKYGDNATNQGSTGVTKYTIEITKLLFKGKAADAVEVKADYFDVGKTLQYLKDDKGADTPIVAPTVTPKNNNDFGAITLAYEGIAPTDYAKSATIPQAVGTYKILVSTAGNTAYKAATDLNVGTLTVAAQAPNWIFKLTENSHIQGLAVGDYTAGEILNDVSGLQGAGGTAWGIVDNGGKKAIQYTISSGGSWEGLDLLNSEFEFAVGDQVSVTYYIVSTASSTLEIFLNAHPADWAPLGANPAIAEGEEKTLDRVVDQATLDASKGEDLFSAIRIRVNNAAVAPGTVVNIREIVITRP